MAARNRLLQMAIAVVNVAIVALVFTSIWPFPSGDFKIDLPSPGEVEWSYSDGAVHVTAPYAIDNGGFYDVKDLVLSYSVTNYTQYSIASDVIEIGTIAAGDVLRSSINFEFDILALYNSGAQWMLFNDDLLNFEIGVSCLYTAELIEFEADYHVSVPWDPLIEGVEIVRPSMPVPGMPYSVDYWLNTSDILSGLDPATVTAVLVDGSGPADTVVEQIQLGGHYGGSVTFDLPSSFNPPYSVVITVQLLDYTISERWDL